MNDRPGDPGRVLASVTRRMVDPNAGSLNRKPAAASRGSGGFGIVSDALLRRLADLGLLEHERYRGVTLTAEGRRVALRIQRLIDGILNILVGK